MAVDGTSQLVVSDLEGHELFATDLISDAYKMKFNSRESHELAVVSDEGTLWVFDLRRHSDQPAAHKRFDLGALGFSFVREEFENAGMLSRRQSLEFSPDGRFLAVRQSAYACGSTGPNQLALINLESGQVTLRPATAAGSGAMTGDILYSADSSTLWVYDLCDSAQTLHRWSTSDPSKYMPVARPVNRGVYAAQDMKGTGLQALLFANGSQWYSKQIALYDPVAGLFEWISSEFAFGPKILAASDSRKLLARAESRLFYRGDAQIRWLAPRDTDGGYRVSLTGNDFATSEDWRFAAALGGVSGSGRSYAILWDLTRTNASGDTLPISQTEIPGIDADLRDARVIGLDVSVSTDGHSLTIDTHNPRTYEIRRSRLAL
jgi:hypothetical protein